MQIRRALKGEQKAIAKLSADSWQVAYAGIMEDEYLQSIDIAAREKGLAREIVNNKPVFVAVEKDAILGFCLLSEYRQGEHRLNDAGEIIAIYVAPAHMRKGCGSALMNTAIEYFSGNGFCKIAIWVLADNTNAIRFYQKHGFEWDRATKEFKPQRLLERRYILDIDLG